MDPNSKVHNQEVDDATDILFRNGFRNVLVLFIRFCFLFFVLFFFFFGDLFCGKNLKKNRKKMKSKSE